MARTEIGPPSYISDITIRDDDRREIYLEDAFEALNADPQLKAFAESGWEINYFNAEDIQNADYIFEQFALSQTSKHELTHAGTAKRLGWEIESVSIVRDGNILGVTRAVPPPGKSATEALLDFMTICCSSSIGEEITGNHDHRGTGSDEMKARYYAVILSNQMAMRGVDVSPEYFYSKAHTRASAIVQSIGRTTLEKQSWNLLRKKVL